MRELGSRYGRNVGLVDINDTYEEDKHVSYCRKCLEYGFHVPLKNRLYPKGQPIPPDNDNWLQCYQCGDIVPIYEVKKEAIIKDFVETVDNPFDIAKELFLGFDKRESRLQNRKKKEMFADINDQDLKKELASGQTRLISYTES